jgi:putative addiction module killer protein
MQPKKHLKIYWRPNGVVPYLKWLNGLRDRLAKQKVQARLNRIRLGNFGKTNSVGQGINELKIDYVPGYRVYFAEDDDQAVIILYGGDKSTQHADIEKAKQHWTSYKQKKSHVDG